MAKPGAVVFVHGILGSDATWSTLLPPLARDPFLAQFFDLVPFSYAAPAVNLNPLKRIPDFRDVADRLTTMLRQDPNLKDRSCLLLVGHSQGGLIIQRMLVDAVRDGRAYEDLTRIRGVVLLATPNAGSQLFLSARGALGWLIPQPQERRLRPFHDEIADIHAALLKRVVYAERASSTCRPIRFDVYTGDQDGVVPAHSARGMFPHTGTLPGDHSTILRPMGPHDLVVRVLVDAARRAFNAPEPDATVLRTEFLNSYKQTDVEAAEALLGQNFLTSENVSPADFRFWLANYERTFGLPLRVIAARHDDRVEGVLMFHESTDADLIVIDYVAIRKDSKVRPLLFNKLISQLSARATSAGFSSVVFEMEDPVALTGKQSLRAGARLRYFEAFGSRIIGGINYLAPNMDAFGAHGEESHYLLMHVATGGSPATLRRERVQVIVRFMYLTWYGNWFSRRYAGREDELRAYVESLYERVCSGVVLPERCLLEGIRNRSWRA